jgi:citrate lyase subunit beta/citryl-CoA lyase
MLYMPGSNARALDKARTLGADGYIFDLEDAVAPDMKGEARSLVAAAVRDGGYRRRELVIRINGLDTDWANADLEAAVAARPDAILVPKVSTPDTVAALTARIDALGAPGELRVWAMMETPLSMLNAGAIAATALAANARLACFVMGTNDLAKETGAALTTDRMPMLAWLSTCVAAARAYGLCVLDGVYNDYRDEAGFEAECMHGRGLGMDGKTLIHPSQIGPCNRVFAPDAQEEAQARRIIAAFEAPQNAGKGAIALDGRMVERLHADIARRTIAIADAVAAMEGEG